MTTFLTLLMGYYFFIHYLTNKSTWLQTFTIGTFVVDSKPVTSTAEVGFLRDVSSRSSSLYIYFNHVPGCRQDGGPLQVAPP